MTYISAYSLRMVLREVVAGNAIAGYTVAIPGGGLFLYARDMPRGQLLGRTA